MKDWRDVLKLVRDLNILDWPCGCHTDWYVKEDSCFRDGLCQEQRNLCEKAYAATPDHIDTLVYQERGKYPEADAAWSKYWEHFEKQLDQLSDENTCSCQEEF